LIFCKHNYTYTQGYFVCRKCGKKSYGNNSSKTNKKQIGIIAGTLSVLVLVALLYHGYTTPSEVVVTVPSIAPAIAHQYTTNTSKEVTITGTLQPPTPQYYQPTPQKLEGHLVPSTTGLEKSVHDGINLERQRQGLNPLVYDPKIADIARLHSLDMVNRNYFEHDTPEGISPSQRGINAGYPLCGDRQAIKDSQEYDTLLTQFKATGNTNRVMYDELQVLYSKVETENKNGLVFVGFPENIEQNNLYDYVTYLNGVPSYHWLSMNELTTSIVQDWMNSSEHKANILTPAYYSEGIGVAISNDDKVYITEDFC
jgi:uncharacterized protein YkwD